MTDTNNATAAVKPVIEVSFTVTLAMTPEQVAAYAREYHIDDPLPASRSYSVRRDVISRAQETAEAALAGEYWIRSFTTVTVSEPRLRATVIL
jgi:hypothetical protein